MERSTFQVPDKYENEADLFATFLAISDDDVCEYISNEYTVQQISNMTGCKENLLSRGLEIIVRGNYMKKLKITFEEKHKPKIKYKNYPRYRCYKMYSNM